MHSRFLSGAELGAAIAEVAAGDDPRCAVAFWGTGASAHLFPQQGFRKVRILCDLSQGGTNPDELILLGAPSNKALRQVERLHAKVYLSKRGAIIGSANASDNGIGFAGASGLIEAGILVEPDSESFKAAGIWFEGLWEKSRKIGPEALAAAEASWNARPPGWGPTRRPIPTDAPSLLHVVAADPERFRGTGFAFTTGAARMDDLAEAARELVRRDDIRSEPLLSSRDRERIDTWPRGDLFTGWSKTDLAAWPKEFVCIHRPAARASYHYYRRVHDVFLEPERGVVFAERPAGLRAELGFRHGSAAMLATDAPLLDRIFDHLEQRGEYHRLCENGERLARLIAEVEAD